jgi:hydroxymethylbilane synthase
MKELILGTRGSKLAIKQTNIVIESLKPLFPTITFKTKIIKTTGDKVQDKALKTIGGKGLFVKEIEEALLNKQIHIAVHSAKDLPADTPKGLTINCVLERNDPRDVMISDKHKSLDEITEGSKIGTGSPRRINQIKSALKRKMHFDAIRGNVDTLSNCRNYVFNRYKTCNRAFHV